MILYIIIGLILGLIVTTLLFAWSVDQNKSSGRDEGE